MTSKKTLFSYGAYMIPVGMIDVPIMLYLPVFYSREIGLDIGLVGLLFVFARIWDGITDPAIGWLSDKTTSRFGRRKPWIVAATPIMMISAWFAFNPPEGVGIFYVAFWLFALFTSWTALYIPYLSLGAELSTEYDERSKVVGYREVCAMIANILVAVGPVVLLANDAPVRDVLMYLFVAMLVLFPLTLGPLMAFVPDLPHKFKSGISLVKGARLLAKNKPFQLFIFAVLLANLAFGMLNAVAIFLLEEGLGLPGEFFKLFLIEYACAIAFSPFILFAAKRLGKHVAMAIGFGLAALSLLTFALGPRESFTLAAIGMGLLGMGYASTFIMPAAILADIIDFDSVSSGEKRAGLYMAVYKFSSKFSMALSIGIAYGILELIGYNAQGGNGEFGIQALKSVGLGIPIVLFLPAIWIILRFPLDRHQHSIIRQQLEADKAI